jgi:hypothetical protein
MVKNYLMENREEDRQAQTKVARWCRSRIEYNGYKKMEAHSKRQNGMGRDRNIGKSSARAVKPERENCKILLIPVPFTPNHMVQYLYRDNSYESGYAK